MAVDFLPLEKAVMAKLLAGDHPILDSLRNQFVEARIKERRFSGVGFFLEFEIDKKLALPGNPNFEIGDIVGTLPDVEHGTDYILFIREGVMDWLEWVTFGEPWPENILEFHLEYVTKGFASERRDEKKLNEKLAKLMG